MAHQTWDFDCRANCRLPEPHCTRCGRTGTYAGFGAGLIEMWGQYVCFYRLSPFGWQKQIADEVMAPVTGRCRDCQGSGLEAAVSDRGFDGCVSCHGTGRIRLCSDEEFERRRQEVIARAGLFQQQPVEKGGVA